MKFVAKFLGVLLLVAGALIAFQYQQNEVHAFSSGSPGGRSGSPGDGQTCRTCHSGSAPISIEQAISTDIPGAGYVPGETYNITAKIDDAGTNMFGFEITAEDNGNAKQGQWIISNASQNRLTNNNRAVTHTSGGRNGSGTKTWQMQWKAPEVNVGAITFYAALMAADGGGGNSGDKLYVSNKKVEPNTTSSIKKSTTKQDLQITVYPNPVKYDLNLKLPKGFEEEYGIYLIDATGVVRAFYENNRPRSGMLKLDVSNLEAGNYIVRIFSDNFTAVRPFIKS